MTDYRQKIKNRLNLPFFESLGVNVTCKTLIFTMRKVCVINAYQYEIENDRKRFVKKEVCLILKTTQVS